MRVLLVEDNAATAKCIQAMLQAENFAVTATASGEDALDLVKVYGYDIVVLDLDLPDIGGMEVLRRLRMAKIRTPVLILSCTSDLEQKVKGLGVGADDFLGKPFERRELVARLRAIVRRDRGHAASVISMGKLVADLDTRCISVDGQRLHLTAKEYEILELMLLRKGAATTKETMMNHLYGGEDEPSAKIIDVYICRLRKKLAEATGGEDYIETYYSQGYALRAPHPKPAALESVPSVAERVGV